MNWEAIGAGGELLGSLVVLLTLVYLSIQVRNAREELKHTIRQNNDAANREIILETVRNPRLTNAFAKTFKKEPSNQLVEHYLDQYDLDVEDAIILTNYYGARFRLLQQTILYDFEFLDQPEKREFAGTTRHLFGSGAGKVFWEFVSKNREIDPEVEEFMRETLSGT